jgi:amino acid transporter
VTELKRNISLTLLLFYGLGTILGAGIYVLTGVVAGHAGSFTPIAFALAAFVAAPTAYSYARLSSQFPKSAGEAVYVREAFDHDWLSQLVGLMVITVGIVSAATIARGFVGYLQVFVQIPTPAIIVVLVTALTGLAAWGVFASVSVAAAIAVLELGGLALVIIGGISFGEFRTLDLAPSLSSGLWPGIFAGALLAFYAFIGFEDIVNMGEETRDPERNLPAAVIGSLLIASILYFLVAYIAVATVPLSALADNEAPMALVVETHGMVSPKFISLISMLAVVNGALVQIIMASRVIYGVAQMHGHYGALGHVNERTRTPLNATLVVGAAVLLLALAFNVESLATITSLITLGIFLIVNLALIRVNRTLLTHDSVIAAIGALLCLTLTALALLPG